MFLALFVSHGEKGQDKEPGATRGGFVGFSGCSELLFWFQLCFLRRFQLPWAGEDVPDTGKGLKSQLAVPAVLDPALGKDISLPGWLC